MDSGLVGLPIKDKLALSRNQLTLREAVPSLVPKVSNHHKIQEIKKYDEYRYIHVGKTITQGAFCFIQAF